MDAGAVELRDAGGRQVDTNTLAVHRDDADAGDAGGKVGDYPEENVIINDDKYTSIS